MNQSDNPTSVNTILGLSNPIPVEGSPGQLPPLPSMDLDAYLDQSFYDMFEFIVNCIVINALSVIGAAGNMLCIFILYLHGFSNSTNITLFSMAIADLLILLSLPLRKISLIIEYFDKPLSITVESYIICYHFLTLNRVWSLTSNAHIALIAVERFLAVYFPFEVSRWITPRCITIIVISLHVIFYVMLIPLFIMFKPIWVFDPNLNTTIAIPSITEFYLSREKTFNFYNSYIVNLLLGALFLLITLICCIGICIKILLMSKKRKGMMESTPANDCPSTAITNISEKTMDDPKSNHDALDCKEVSFSRTVGNDNLVESNISRKQRPKTRKLPASRIDFKVVKMLLIVCFTYIVLVFPSSLLFVFQEIYEELREPYWRRVNFLATSISMFLIGLNSSLNFIIYVANSNKFYESFRRLMKCGKNPNF